MIVKQCQFPGQDENGIYFHLVHPGYDNLHLTKTAASTVSAPQLEVVQRILRSMNKRDGTIYSLISTLGAAEYWGGNNNGDHFGLDALIHTPPNWNQLNLEQQKVVGRRWEWGYPTFYNAHAFAHHVNSDPARAFGTIEYVFWDSLMKRVLLLVAIDRARAAQCGAGSVLDRIDNGEFPDTSMGARVPFDVCSLCGDWSRILPNRDNPRQILEEHRRKPIRGLNMTTADYCYHLRCERNKIYPNGLQVRMVNLHPRFFDISLVFIGAEKTSKMLAKVADTRCPIRENAPMCKTGCYDYAIPSSHVSEVWARKEKTAAAQDGDSMLKEGFGIEDFDIDPREEQDVAAYFRPGRLLKRGEIAKRVQSNFRKLVLPKLEVEEPDFPDELQDSMSERLSDALSTAGSLGIVAKPREFQRMYVRALGRPRLADDLRQRGICFRLGRPPAEDFRLSREIVPRLLNALLPLICRRSAFSDPLHARIIIIAKKKPVSADSTCEMEDPFLDKVGSAYSAYRRDLLYKTASLVENTIHLHPHLLGHVVGDVEPKLVKTGSDMMESVIGMLSTAYFNQAYTQQPVSGFVDEHCNVAGLREAEELAVRGGVA